MTFKPILAYSKTPPLSELSYPVIASPKLDGIRCIAIRGSAYSRTMKLIPNKHVQRMFAEYKLDGFDGELMLASGADFNSVQSAFMSTDGKPPFLYHVFDYISDGPFTLRLELLHRAVAAANCPMLILVDQVLETEEAGLRILWDSYNARGYEGAIVRSPAGPYKQGRSTLNQGYMIKLKTFSDDEASVVGFVELLHNTNTDTKEQANMIPGGILGSLIVSWNGLEFNIGSGFDMSQRKRYWDDRELYLGKKVSFKYQELSKYGVPRFPTFKGFRYE